MTALEKLRGGHQLLPWRRRRPRARDLGDDAVRLRWPRLRVPPIAAQGVDGLIKHSRLGEIAVVPVFSFLTVTAAPPST